jgi:hypothetical protein
MAIQNGGFEDGDLTGWTPSGDTAYDTEEASAAAKLFGDYGGHLLIKDFGTDPAYAQIDQEIGALSAGDLLTFWYKINAADVGADGQIEALLYEVPAPEIGENLLFIGSPSAGGWIEIKHTLLTSYINANLQIYVYYDPGT